MTEALEGLEKTLAGRYLIDRELGRGGMATVYLAGDLKDHRQVAIKVFHPDLAAGLGAEVHYDRFVTWWEYADPPLRPLWQEGRQALARLGGEPRKATAP